MKRRLVAVAYEFNTPAVMPQSQVSSEQKTGFRISAGGLACADKVTVTLKFKDGQSQQVAVDGCRLAELDASQRTPATSATSSRKRGLWLSI